MHDLIFKIDRIKGGYDKKPVIDNISLEIKTGDFLGIIGPNGSGKSTLLRLATRVLTPYEGSVSLLGKDIREISLKEFSKSVAFVTHDTTNLLSLSVMETVLLGRIPHLKRMQFETKKDYQIAEHALLVTDALYLKDKDIDELSAGERQRVIIARALAQEPILLFLDEPTSHMDIAHQIQLLDLLKTLNRETKLSIVIVLHDLNLASEYCDKIILLNEGEIFKEGAPDEVLTYQNIEHVYKTLVIVKENPISHRPYIILVSGENKCRQK